MIKRAFALALIAAICFAGCKEEVPEPEPTVDLPPPEPTADEIHQELYAAVQVLWRPVAGGSGLSLMEVDAAVNQFRATLANHQQHEHMGEAEQRIRNQLQELIKTAEEMTRWRSVKGGIAAYKVINPGSTRYDRLDQYADQIMARPWVRVGGFATVGDDTFILFRITDPDTQEITNERARVGERFANGLIEVVEIIGNNQKVRLNYLPINDDSWIEAAPKALN
jgi:hypothetical protein